MRPRRQRRKRRQGRNRPRSLTRRPRARRGQPEGDPRPDRIDPEHLADHPCHGAGRRVPHEAGAGGDPGRAAVRRRAALGAEPRDGGDRRGSGSVPGAPPGAEAGPDRDDHGSRAGGRPGHQHGPGGAALHRRAGGRAKRRRPGRGLRDHRRAQGSRPAAARRHPDRRALPAPRGSTGASPTSLPSRGWWPRTSWPRHTTRSPWCIRASSAR